MHRYIVAVAVLAAFLAFIYSDRLGMDIDDGPAEITPQTSSVDGMPERAVLDITVHSVEELQVLFERAEQLARVSRPEAADASIVLVLHGPEVEFFSTRNYDEYRDIVDRAARLDSLDIVDVRICQTMMAAHGIARDDIPPFIEQVPDGGVEVQQLLGEGYVYF